jgi:hypothetical protein
VQNGLLGLGCVIIKVDDVLDGLAVQVGDVISGLPGMQAVQRRGKGSDEYNHRPKKPQGSDLRNPGAEY